MTQTLRSLQPENKLPDCVFMKLHSEPVQTSKAAALGFQLAESAPRTPIEQIDLKLTIRFNKATIKCPGGMIEFGLKRGELTLQLENGKIPLEKIALKAEFAKALEVEEQEEKGRGAEAALSVTFGTQTAISPSGKIAGAGKATSKIKRLISQVHNHGTEERPRWTFEAFVDRVQPILEGNFTEEFLGTLEVTGTPCSLTATFRCQNQSDIHLFDSSGLIAGKNLSRNKTAWAAREFFLRFIAPKLQPYLSRVEGEL